MRTILLLPLALVALAGAAHAETFEQLVELHELGPGSYHLSPPRITLRVGDTADITVVNPANNTQSHDLVLCGEAPDEDADCEDRWGLTPIFGPGEERKLVAKLERAGTFEYYCSIPGHKTGTPGMRGELIVVASGATPEKESPGLAPMAGLAALLAIALVLRRR